jgi:type III secretion protein U
MGEKTKKPTPHKLRKARERGEVVRSRELTSLAGFVALWVCLGFGAEFCWRHLAHIIDSTLTTVGSGPDVTPVSWRVHLQSVLADALWILLPLVGIGMLCAVLVGGLQTRGMVSMTPITPKFERINPGQALQRLFSTRQWLELGKMLVKTTLLLGLLGYFCVTSLDALVTTTYTPAAELPGVAAKLLWRLMGWAALVYVCAGVMDYAHQFFEFMKQQKMSIEELRQERRDFEGNPQIKGRRRAIAREAILNPQPPGRPLAASVVVVNPTHFAVALYYEPRTTPLPRVVAKGVDAAALSIRARAERDGVPVLQDPPLARRIFREVPLDHYISDELVDAVARVFRWINARERLSRGSVRLGVRETKSNTPHRVNQPREVRPVDFPPQPGDVHVNDIVEGGGTPDVFPDFVR